VRKGRRKVMMERTKNTAMAMAAVVLLAGGVVLGAGEVNAEGDNKKPSQLQTSSVGESSRSETAYSLEQEDSDSRDGVWGNIESDLEQDGAGDTDDSQDEITADVLGITMDELDAVHEKGGGLERLAEDGGYLSAEEYLQVVRSAMAETGFRLVDD
jgi:hypothetical protein